MHQAQKKDHIMKMSVGSQTHQFFHSGPDDDQQRGEFIHHGGNSFTSSLFGSNTVIVVTRVTTQPVLWPIDDRAVVSGLIDPDLGL